VKTENLRIGGLAAGEGGVWRRTSRTCSTSIPSPQHSARVHVDSPFPKPIVAFRTVWIATNRAIQRINPATDELLRPIDLRPIEGIPIPRTSPRGALPRGWPRRRSCIGSVRPQNEIIREIPIEGSSGLAAGEDGVWVIDKLSGALTAFAPRPVT
jgi:hypothetical protein